MAIGITGPRTLCLSERSKVFTDMSLIVRAASELVYVGDADGVDAIAVHLAGEVDCRLMLYKKRADLPGRARCAERTTRMVKALAATGGTLHGWPNKPAPPNLKPSRGWPRGAAGSGTWGAIALATGLGIPVILHPLNEFEAPEWLQVAQLPLV